MSFERLLATRTNNMKASVIRETLKVVSQPGIISLAGGIPAPESFPIDIFDELTTRVLQKYGPASLQYGPSEGFGPLREALVGLLAERGVAVTADDIVITSGSQGTLDTLGKILISKGDYVAVEAPTYMGAISAFNPYEPQYVSIVTDNDGVIPEALDETLAKFPVKFIYLIPTFQNPSGRTITLERRKAIAEIIKKHDALLVEDDPYSAIRYRGQSLPTIKSMAPDHVVYTSTMSKILSPGMRLGFTAAPPLIKKWMVLAKQGVDLHTSSLDQALAAEYIAAKYLDRQLPRIVALYKPRLEAMLNALEKYFPDDFTWSEPDGGMFVWAEGPEGLDTDTAYRKAVDAKVAFVPGKYFYVTKNQGLATMRLNFSMVNETTIDRGIRILADVLKRELAPAG